MKEIIIKRIIKYQEQIKTPVNNYPQIRKVRYRSSATINRDLIQVTTNNEQNEPPIQYPFMTRGKIRVDKPQRREYSPYQQ